MAPTPKSDDELLDIYEGKVPLPAGWVRGKYAARFAAADAKNTLDLSEPTGLRPTGAALNGVPGQQAENWRVFREKLIREWAPLADSCTVPIWEEAAGRVWPVGTGTLFRVADASFMVSASHVLKSHGPARDLFVPSITADRALRVPIDGRLVGSDTDDIGVVELSDATAAGVSDRTFLNVRQADRRGIRPRGGVFTFYGYPAETSAWVGSDTTEGLITGPVCSLTRPYPGDPGVLPGHDPYAHILLWYPTYGENLDGTQFRTPDPAGLSGCSLWQVYWPGCWVPHWTAHEAVVVAVQTHADRDLGYIRGTRWWVVDQLIRDGWPHLAPALSLAVPDPAPAV